MTDTDPAAPGRDDEGDSLPTLTLIGELEDATAVRSAIHAASRGHEVSIRLDLSDVTYMPSHIVGVLFVAIRAASEAGSVLEVAAKADSIVDQILRIVGMPHVAL